MHQEILNKLKHSKFRSRFHLKETDKQYIAEKGIDIIEAHAKDFISKRIAPAVILNDGKQTPMRGHPVFIAQHATACCCRECIYKWHHLPKDIELNTLQQEYLVNLIMSWIEKQL